MAISTRSFQRSAKKQTETIPEDTGNILWAAELEERSDLSAYAVVIQRSPDRITIIDDPANLPRKVLKITALNEDVYPYTVTENPRAQAETPTIFEEGNSYWIGQSLYIPEVSYFPVPTTADPWISIGSVYGPPFAGSGPNGLSLASVNT